MDKIILNIIKLSLPAFIVFLTVYTMLNKLNQKEERLKILELKKKHTKESLPIRLQSYERLTLLMHRIAPENLIPRVQNPSMNVKTLGFALLKTLKSEFEHNITQQIYVSTPTWDKILQYNAELTQLIKEKTVSLDPNDSSLKLAEAILTEIMQNSNVADYRDVMASLKSEVKHMFL